MLGMVAAALVPVTAAGAITGGEPDTAHPSVGLVRFTRAGDVPSNDHGWCTGTLIADRVVLTAGHCIEWPDGPRTDFFVTFSPVLLNHPLVDPSVADQYVAGTGVADPRWDFYDQGPTRSHDRGVILLEESARAKWGIDPVPLPPVGFLDGVNHGKAAGATMTLVGYGVAVTDRPGKADHEVNDHRQVTTGSLANTHANEFRIQMNRRSANAEGGACFGDSGSPAFFEPWPYALGTLSRGDSINCTAWAAYSRNDTVAAREFIGQFVPLP